MKKAIVTVLALLAVFSLSAAEAEEVSKDSTFILPAASYSPETSYVFMVLGSFMKKPFENTPASMLSPVISYSLKNQSTLKLTADCYLENYSGYIVSIIQYRKYPEAFFGIGGSTLQEDEEIYTAEREEFSLEYHHRLFSSLFAGAAYRFERRAMLSMEEGGMLERGVYGAETGNVSGLGILLKWDSRNSTNFALDGSLHKILVTSYGPSSGSSYSFSEWLFDFRHFIRLADNIGLAVNPYMKNVTGNPPFDYLSKFGGLSRMRGYYEGKYRDRSMAFIQSEIKMRLHRFFGLGIFAGTGNVFDDPSTFTMPGLKFAAGLSMKAFIIPDNDYVARIDIAAGKDGLNFYVDIGDSF